MYEIFWLFLFMVCGIVIGMVLKTFLGGSDHDSLCEDCHEFMEHERTVNHVRQAIQLEIDLRDAEQALMHYVDNDLNPEFAKSYFSRKEAPNGTT